jgi:hypothetical protein
LRAEVTALGLVAGDLGITGLVQRMRRQFQQFQRPAALEHHAAIASFIDDTLRDAVQRAFELAAAGSHLQVAGPQRCIGVHAFDFCRSGHCQELEQGGDQPDVDDRTLAHRNDQPDRCAVAPPQGHTDIGLRIDLGQQREPRETGLHIRREHPHIMADRLPTGRVLERITEVARQLPVAQHRQGAGLGHIRRQPCDTHQIGIQRLREVMHQRREKVLGRARRAAAGDRAQRVLEQAAFGHVDQYTLHADNHTRTVLHRGAQDFKVVPHTRHRVDIRIEGGGTARILHQLQIERPQAVRLLARGPLHQRAPGNLFQGHTVQVEIGLVGKQQPALAVQAPHGMRQVAGHRIIQHVVVRGCRAITRSSLRQGSGQLETGRRI